MPNIQCRVVSLFPPEVGSTGSGEPPAKRLHIEQDGDISMDQSIKVDIFIFVYLPSTKKQAKQSVCKV